MNLLFAYKPIFPKELNLTNWIMEFWFILFVVLCIVGLVFYKIHGYLNREHTITVHFQNEEFTVSVKHNSSSFSELNKLNIVGGYFIDRECVLPFNPYEKTECDIILFTKSTKDGEHQK